MVYFTTVENVVVVWISLAAAKQGDTPGVSSMPGYWSHMGFERHSQ